MLIYLIRQDQSDFYKIGITSNIKQRIKSIQTGCPNRVEVLATFESKYARNIEGFLHRVWHHLNTNGEWFQLGKDELKEFIPLCKKMNENLIECNKIKSNLDI